MPRCAAALILRSRAIWTGSRDGGEDDERLGRGAGSSSDATCDTPLRDVHTRTNDCNGGPLFTHRRGPDGPETGHQAVSGPGATPASRSAARSAGDGQAASPTA